MRERLAGKHKETPHADSHWKIKKEKGEVNSTRTRLENAAHADRLR